MSCSNENCKIVSDSERSIVCWLCTNLWHAKCAGIPARVVDILYGENNGLKWCCLKCRKINVDFYKFVKNYSSEVAQMGKELWALYERFNNFTSVIDKFPDLDAFVCSPDVAGQKRKRSTKSALSKKLDTVVPSTSGPAASDVPKNSSDSVDILKTSSVDQQCVANATAPAADDVVPTREESSAVHSGTIPNPPANTALQVVSRPKTLTVVPAKKVVFVSRFAPDTSSDDVNFYIKSKITGEFYLRIFKIRSSSPISRSSFKIIVPTEIFDKLIDRNFWPPKAFVKEFVDRVDNLAHLPSRQSNSSKN